MLLLSLGLRLEKLFKTQICVPNTHGQRMHLDVKSLSKHFVRHSCGTLHESSSILSHVHSDSWFKLNLFQIIMLRHIYSHTHVTLYCVCVCLWGCAH